MQSLSNATEAGPLAGECARELLSGIPGVMRFIRGHMRAHRSGLTVPHFRALVFLSLIDRPSLSELAEHLGLSLPAASRMVDLLVRRGLIARKHPADDRRRVCLLLTASGRRTFETAHQATQVALSEHLRTLSRSELARLHEGMRVLSQAFTNGNHKDTDRNKLAKPPRRRTGVLP